MIASKAIGEQARALGFDLCGVAPAAALPELTGLADWLARGHAGDMHYMHRSAETRLDIRRFLASARSVIVTATNYYVGGTADTPASASPPIARYAWGEDYHVVLAARLEQLAAWIGEQIGEAFEYRIFVDKHHVQERAFARYAGLGWIGKNTMLIHPDAGSYTFLAGMAVSLDLDAGEPMADHCGSCTLCIDACPTGALVDEYELDARRCISYLTIEHKGPIPEAQRPQIGAHIYGCDVCQEVCPYNLAPLPTSDPAWQPRAGRADASPEALWQQSDFDLHRLIAGSAMTRAPVARLRRNLAVVLGNSHSSTAAAVLDHPGAGVKHAAPAAATELVQEHIDWAKEALGVR